ncbi:MAG TPA: hypothetical protein VGK58_12890 [Lacipirellulaceae bacterium]
MAKQAENSARDRSKRSETQSTIAVSREIADKVRDIANANDATVFEMANALLDYALQHTTINIEPRRVAIVPADQLKDRQSLASVR